MKGGLAAPLLGTVMRSRMRDVIARLVAYVIALVLLATAFGFLVATLYLALAKVAEAPLAALLTALALAGAAGLGVRKARYPRPRKPAARALGADAQLLSMAEQVRRDPWLSLAIAAVLGVLTEISHPSSKRPPG